MKYILKFILVAFLSINASAQQNFDIKIIRQSVSNNLVKGKLYVNGKYLGTTYENDALKINEGKYSGYLRYISQNGHVQGPLGNISNKGDFLLEVGNVKWSDGKARSNILFHGGNKPHHSKGCIMLGGVPRDSEGNRYLPKDHTLSKLRKEFYGTDTPNSSPNKKITIEIVDVFLFGGKWSVKDDGDIIQLVISKSGSTVSIKYNWIWDDGEIDRYVATNVKLVNSNKITFKLNGDGDNYNCELQLSSDKKSIKWKMTDVSDGYSDSTTLRKN
ncbi:DUF5675 family protein [Aureispira sp. CCB-QB1]|uniref:DUF5675 family protein n=1 Tax=Aureispira sp. CCB-QB1 TaxID=1313421 RepID=UPI00069632D5|nr:DUF5675 family protein [Aureispira sp. CCB-QB1]